MVSGWAYEREAASQRFGEYRLENVECASGGVQCGIKRGGRHVRWGVVNIRWSLLNGLSQCIQIASWMHGRDSFERSRRALHLLQAFLAAHISEEIEAIEPAGIFGMTRKIVIRGGDDGVEELPVGGLRHDATPF
jgi:hypothetical protein